MRQRHSDYILWAKTQSRARFNLATSGVGSFPLRELPVTIDQLEINGDSTYGYAPLQQALAKKCGVDPDCVVASAGTSMANHLAMATLIDPGDEVVVEQPTYEVLTSTLLYLGAVVKHFARTEESGYALDPTQVRRVVTRKTRLIVLCNLHNPSSALASETALREIGGIARSVGARVLVDEVYLDLVYTNTPKTSFLLGPEFVVTNSLTKAYGLSGLRCGWVLAAPELVERMWHIHDLYGVNAAHPAERLSAIALDNLDSVAQRAKQVLAANRPVLDSFLQSRDDLACVRPAFGTVAFPKLLTRSVQELDRLLREKYETGVVPGHFFDAPQHFRIGIGGDPEMTRAAFERLGKALDELR